MVAPIIGPFPLEIGGTGPDDKPFYKNTVGYRQTKPYSEPTFYRSHIGQVIGKVGNPPGAARKVGTSLTFDSVNFTHVQNRSYDKLKSEVGEKAEWAVGLAQLGQSWSMIADRTTQILRFTRAVRKFDFPSASKALGLATVPKGVSRKRAFASNWLEYSYGWVPLIGDIGTAIEVLQNPILPITIRAGTKSQLAKVDLQVPTHQFRPTAVNDWCEWRVRETITWPLIAMAQGCQVEVTNPNLWRANQMGFVNPFLFGLELIPFSFVLDWFVNVSSVVSSFTDFHGLTLRREWNVKHARCVYEYDSYKRFRWWVSGTYFPKDSYYFTTQTDRQYIVGVHTYRTTGLAGPVLYVRPYKAPSMKRAANAIALLVLALK